MAANCRPRIGMVAHGVGGLLRASVTLEPSKIACRFEAPAGAPEVVSEFFVMTSVEMSSRATLIRKATPDEWRMHQRSLERAVRDFGRLNQQMVPW